jgi:hypothetical protein
MDINASAPDPSSLGEKKVIIKKTAVKQNEGIDKDNPSVAVYGCGGMGTNIINQFGKDLSNKVKIRIIDTSKSNLINTPYETTIIDGNGSGKLRGANVESINKYISSEAFVDKEPEDINIVIFSLSGGSGSVIGPLLIKELHRQNKAVVALVVAETISQLDTENTSRTFMSLEGICEADDIYLPVMVFDNSFTRSKVDNAIKHRLTILTDFLTTNVFELDKSDKINWLRPDITIDAVPGVYGCHFAIGKTGDYDPESGEIMVRPEDHLFDSIIFVANKPDQLVTLESRILYHGFDTSAATNIIGMIGFPISTKLIETINSRLSKFQSQVSSAKPLGFKTKKTGSGHNSGIVI